MEEMVMKTANLIKKIEFMKNQYQLALTWVNQELQNPSVVEGITLEEKVQKLTQAKLAAEKGLEFVRCEELKLEFKMEELNLNSIMEVSRVISEF